MAKRSEVKDEGLKAALPEEAKKPEIDPRDTKLAEMEARLAAKDAEWADRMERIAASAGRGPAPLQAEAPDEALPTEDEIAEAVESGVGKKAAKLMAKLQRGLSAQSERRTTERINAATSAAANRLEKFARAGAKDIPYYDRFKPEIEKIIRERGIDATDPEAIRLVTKLVTADHMEELMEETRQESLRKGADEGEAKGLAAGGSRRKRRGDDDELRAIPVSDDIRDTIEDMGFEGENEFAESKGFKDPSGQGRHWDYMHKVGRGRERAAKVGANGQLSTSAKAANREWVEYLRGDAESLKKTGKRLGH